MFGQTIKSGGGDGRGRKKGYEMPNHKWIARIPTPSGVYRYIYDRAELAAVKNGNKQTAPKSSMSDRFKQLKVGLNSKRFENNRYKTPEEKAAYQRRQDEFNRNKFKRHAKAFINRKLKDLDFNGDGKTNIYDARYKIKNSKAYRFADANGNNRLDREDAKIHLGRVKKKIGSVASKLKSLRKKRNDGYTPAEKAAYDRRKKDFEKMRFNQRLQKAADEAAKRRYQKSQKYKQEAGYNTDRGKSSGAVNSYNLYKNIANVKSENSRKKYAGQGDTAHYGLKNSIGKRNAQKKYDAMKERYSGSKAALRPKDWREDTYAKKMYRSEVGNKEDADRLYNISNQEFFRYYHNRDKNARFSSDSGLGREIARRSRDRRRSNRRK